MNKIKTKTTTIVAAVLALSGIMTAERCAASSAIEAPANVQLTSYMLFDREFLDPVLPGRPLYAPDANFNFSSNAYGIFTGLDEDIWDYRLYLFPNGNFAIEYDCHCATPAYFMYLGSYQRKGNVLTFSLQKKSTHKGCVEDSKEFTTRFGDLSKMDFFVTTQDGQITKYVLAPEPTLMKAPMDRLFVRRKPIKDWQTQLAKIELELGRASN